MIEWKIKFCGVKASEEFEGLTADLKAKFLHILELIEEFGPFGVGMPHIKHLDGKLLEMRLKGKDNIARSIFFISSPQEIMILHTFIKKSQKTPEKSMQLALKRLKEETENENKRIKTKSS